MHFVLVLFCVLISIVLVKIPSLTVQFVIPICVCFIQARRGEARRE